MTATQKLDPWEIVAYRGVPMFRALSLALLDAANHGAPHLVMSADRRDAVIEKFNREHGTHLHGQEFLIHMHQVDPVHWFPANPKDETSHCLRSDGNRAYRRADGTQIPRKGKLPRYMLGIDAQDVGPHAQANDCTHLVKTLNRLGYKAKQPYSAGSERHHFVIVENPAPLLRKKGLL